MIDHISTYATDYIKTKGFYEVVFSALGYTLQTEFKVDDDENKSSNHICAFGQAGKSTFWVIETNRNYTPRHLAFVATSRAAVDEFYKLALKSGGLDNGAPCLRPAYHEHYYGAFVIDPDGNDIEAVFHDRE